MKLDFRLRATRFFTVIQTQLQTKVRSLQLAATQFFTVLQTKAGSIQSNSVLALQSSFRSLRLWLSTLTNLNPQSMLLRLLALAAAALMTVLAIGGIQTITRETWSSEVPGHQSQSAQSSSPSSKTWAGLPVAPSESDKPAQKPTQAKASTKASPTAKANQPKVDQAKSSQPQATSPQASPKAASKTQPKPPAKTSPQPISPVPSAVVQSNLGALAPRQEVAPAHPTNYGDRYAKDVFGKPAEYDPLIVLHETVWSADSAINTVRTPHYDEDDQSSYHSIIRLDGTIVYVVPPEKRAYGAGNSVFKSAKGTEAVKTHRAFPPSVNNFAYHVSLETPADGHNSAETHSGYTDAQYLSLAWLVAHTSVTDDRVTTHRSIDQSGSRIDPRSFDAAKFYSYLRALPRAHLPSP